MMKKQIAFAALLGLGSSVAMAQQAADLDAFYAGAGINVNQLSGFDDSTGWQIFLGYDLPFRTNGGIRTALEVGYTDFRTFDTRREGIADYGASGVWASGVAAWPLNQTISFLGRLGVDFGDEDGLLVGFGAGFNMGQGMQLRAEWVSRDNVDSLQGNFLVRF